MISKETAPSDFLANPKSFESTMMTAKIRRWGGESMFPLGIVSGVLGQIGELPAESEALLVGAGVTWDDFSELVLESLVPTPWTIPEKEYLDRLDLRNECVFSIDPPTARDLDDAISLKMLEKGKYEIGVHIADVSYFVRPATTLDYEAQNRSTSVYLVQKVIPMLPRLLCEELCSLNPGVDRLSFSVFWIFDEDANIIGDPVFKRTIINSCAKLSYNHAQCVIEGRDWSEFGAVPLSGKWTTSDIENNIKQFYKFSQILRRKRYENGALSLNSLKLWFNLDECGNPVETGVYESKEANRLIEEVIFFLI